MKIKSTQIKHILSLGMSIALLGCGGTNFGGAQILAEAGALVITSPSAGTHYSNTSSLTISGTCGTGKTIALTGADTQTTTCTGGAFSFTVSQGTDGTRSYLVTQYLLSADEDTAESAARTWVRDTAVPTAPTLLSLASPYVSGDTDIVVAGECENGTTVSLSGDATSAVVCALSAYSFTVSKNVDATYNFTIVQVDRAGNISSSTALQWVRDVTIPPTPTILTPSTNPYFTSGNTIVVSGNCVAGNNVYLAGADTQGPIVCDVAGNYTFTTASKTIDGTYSFYVTQESVANDTISSEASQTWIRDTGVPSAPVRLNPPSSPVTSSGSLLIDGTCEAYSTVTLAGDDSQTTTCSASGTYEFYVAKSVDATYNFTVSQADRAGNASLTTSVSWNRNSTMPATPTITSPATNPYVYNGNSILLGGGCTTGATVTLAGSDSQVTTCVGGAYSFTINKASDGVYDFTVKQNSGIDSGLIAQRWLRDATVPVITLSGQPAATNLSVFSKFVFSANESVSFECSLDGGAYTACTSPLTYSALTNGAHNWQVRATDLAGNVTTNGVIGWTQAAYKTIALYHLDSAGATTDSSLYTAGNNNLLTDVSTTNATGVNCVFTDCRVFSGTARMTVNDTPSLSAVTDTLTVEARVKMTTFNNLQTIIGQHAASAGNYGWELRIRKGGGKLKVAFYSSTSSTTGTEVLASGKAYTTGTWVHVAAVYNKGAVKLYLNGAQVGSGTLSATSLNNSPAAMRLGEDSAGANRLVGSLDEVRVSQWLRYTAPFSVPGSAFTAD